MKQGRLGGASGQPCTLKAERLLSYSYELYQKDIAKSYRHTERE